MLEPRLPTSNRVLDPVARVSEILFGVIMALTFTGSISVTSAGHEEIRTVLVGAIGCNIAWGLVDGVMYLMTRLTERGRELATVRAVRASGDPIEGRRIVASTLPPYVAANLPENALEHVRTRMAAASDSPAGPRLARQDYLGAVAVFLLVVVATFPVVMPFVFMSDAARAMRVSNTIAVVLMFLCGFRLGHYSVNRPWRMGIAMALIGALLVAITIALGG